MGVGLEIINTESHIPSCSSNKLYAIIDSVNIEAHPFARPQGKLSVAI